MWLLWVFVVRGIISMTIKSKMQEKIKKDENSKTFNNVCPYISCILHVHIDAYTDTRGIAISSSALKCSNPKSFWHIFHLQWRSSDHYFYSIFYVFANTAFHPTFHFHQVFLDGCHTRCTRHPCDGQKTFLVVVILVIHVAELYWPLGDVHLELPTVWHTRTQARRSWCWRWDFQISRVLCF